MPGLRVRRADWCLRSRTQAEVQRLRREAATAERAPQALAAARSGAQALLTRPPDSLRRAAPAGVDASALLPAWER